MDHDREDGVHSGARNIGRLALWTIPLALGMGAVAWLGFVAGSRQFWNTISQEQRRAVYVGADHRPKAKLNILLNNDRSSVKIDRVDLDGEVAAVYFHNSGTGRATYIQLHWQLVSPDGTALSSKWGYTELLSGPQSLAPGERGEAIFQGYYAIELDSRAGGVRFWAGR